MRELLTILAICFVLALTVDPFGTGEALSEVWREFTAGLNN